MTNSGQTPRIFQSRYRSALSYLGALTAAQITAIGPQSEGTLVYNTTLEVFLIYNAAGVPVSIPDFARTITVALSGGDFTTVSAGLTAAAALAPPPSAADPAIVLVYPGVYVETITLIAFVSVIGVGGPSSITIAAPLTTDTIVTGVEAASLRGVTLSGASGAAGTGISHTAAGLPLVLFNCAVLDCETGYSFSGAGVVVHGSFISANRFPGQVLVTAIEILAGATLRVSNVNIEGTGASRINTGLSMSGAGTAVTIAVGSINFADDAIFIDDSAAGIGNTIEIISSINGLHLGAVGAPVFQGGGLTISSSSTWDLLQDSTAGTFLIDSSNFLSEKSSIPTGSSTILVHISLTPGDEALTIFGELHVGRFTEGRESAFGGGDSYVLGMNVFRNSSGEAGAWSDVTAEAASNTGSTFSGFPGTAVANALYFGGTVPFPGLKTNTLTALVLGAGSVDWEFWNGAAWTPFNVMAADSNAPFAQFANTPFERANFEQIRFGTMTGWVTKTLTTDPFGAGAKYWARAIISSAAISTIPVIQQIKLHSNHTEINADGMTEFFGTARVIRALPFNRVIFQDVVGATLGNQNLLFTTAIRLVTTDNNFASNALDAVGAETSLPEGLDTSLPLSLRYLWAGSSTTGAAQVEWEVNFAQIQVGDTIDGSIVDPAPKTLIVGPQAFTADVLLENSFTLDVPALLPSEIFALRLFRDATGGNLDDTYGGATYIADISITGTFWR